MEDAKKPTLLQLRRRHNEQHSMDITPRMVADRAGVRPCDEFTMEIGRPVSAAIANRVVNAFNTLTKGHYTFADITMTLKPAEHEDLTPYIRGLRAVQ